MAIDTKKLAHSDDYNALCADAKTRISEVDADTVEALMQAGEGFCLIDVRDADEFEAGHLNGAIFISKGWIEAKIHNVAASKDEKIVLYCGSGNRSALSAENLQKMGYTDVHSMAGGIKGWVKAGKAVEA